MKRDVAAIGESMVEIKPEGFDPSAPLASAQVGYGGDTMNFCVYMARMGRTPCFVSAMGDDAASAWLIARWRSEGVDCELVQVVPGAVPGLYMIDTDEHGERSFIYWRDQAPVRQMLATPARRDSVFKALKSFAFIYLSGISLAVLPDASRTELFDFLATYRRGGGRVIFDNNYRPALWLDVQTAADAFKTAYQCTDIALPTLDDENQVFGTASPEKTVERLISWGCKEVALKNGALGSTVFDGDKITAVAATPVITVVDTTAAGDSFNAGYMAARLDDKSALASAKHGHALAAHVVQHPGAIIPVSVTDKLK